MEVDVNSSTKFFWYGVEPVEHSIMFRIFRFLLVYLMRRNAKFIIFSQNKFYSNQILLTNLRHLEITFALMVSTERNAPAKCEFKNVRLVDFMEEFKSSLSIKFKLIKTNDRLTGNRVIFKSIFGKSNNINFANKNFH